jgi:hypothetical protein
MERIILAAAVTLAAASPLMAEGEALAKLRTRLALQRESHCGWDELFRHGTASGEPCGRTRGTVLLADGPAPRLKARLQNLAWKGKTFPGDGTLVNRWPLGLEAVSAQTSLGTSLFDGQPCLVMQYAPDAPVFPGVRDELREISPGTWLGRNYNGDAGEFKGYFLLQSK